MNEQSVFLTKVVPTMRKYTETAIDWLSVLLLSGIFALGIAQVFWRWALNNPIVWSEELIQLVYVWICYLGWTIAARKDTHIRITTLVNILPKTAQKWIQLFCHVLCIVFSVLMVYYGIKLVGVGFKRTAVSFPLNFAVVYAIGPFCNFVIICYEIAAMIECITKGPKDYKDVGGEEE